MDIIKVTPRGYCRGVVRAINIAKQAAHDYPKDPIYVLGMLVHNAYVVEALRQIGIEPLDDEFKTKSELLDEIKTGVIIFTAHGIAPSLIEKAQQKGLRCIDASCPNVITTQKIVANYLEKGFEVLYIGKKSHPEAEAICSLSNHVHLIEFEHDIETNLGKNIFVTNQTTMSIFDVNDLFKSIKIIYPSAIFSEEICDATRIRQEAIAKLENIDVLYVVGDIHSNNSNRLAQIGKEHGINDVYLIDDVHGISSEQLINKNRIAITSGASTPTYLTNQVIDYLEQYERRKEKPNIQLFDIL
ncbi:MAG: 4-hydroxy-3-methylbut-2-enyl diphosphate reductase [Erysipelotrichaceae bacterium]